MEKSFAIAGWIREDSFGRIVIDQCPSDWTHLRYAPTDPVVNKPTCRYLLEEFFTRGTEIIGRKGHLTVSFQFTEDTVAGPIEEAVQKFIEQGEST